MPWLHIHNPLPGDDFSLWGLNEVFLDRLEEFTESSIDIGCRNADNLTSFRRSRHYLVFAKGWTVARPAFLDPSRNAIIQSILEEELAPLEG